MESSDKRRRPTSRRLATTAPVSESEVRRPDGFDITYEAICGRVEYGDGNQSPGEAAMAQIGRLVDGDGLRHFSSGGTFRFPGPDEGQTVEVKVSFGEAQDAPHPGEEAVRLVLARCAARRESVTTSIKFLTSEGRIPNSVSRTWLNDRVRSLIAEYES